MQKLSKKMQMLVQVVVERIAYVVKSTTTDRNGLSPTNYLAKGGNGNGLESSRTHGLVGNWCARF